MPQDPGDGGAHSQAGGGQCAPQMQVSGHTYVLYRGQVIFSFDSISSRYPKRLWEVVLELQKNQVAPRKSTWGDTVRDKFVIGCTLSILKIDVCPSACNDQRISIMNFE